MQEGHDSDLEILLSFSTRVLYIAKHFLVVRVFKRKANKTAFHSYPQEVFSALGRTRSGTFPAPHSASARVRSSLPRDSSSRVLKPRSAGVRGSYPGGWGGEPPPGKGKKNLERNRGRGEGAVKLSVCKPGPGLGVRSESVTTHIPTPQRGVSRLQISFWSRLLPFQPPLINFQPGGKGRLTVLPFLCRFFLLSEPNKVGVGTMPVFFLLLFILLFSLLFLILQVLCKRSEIKKIPSCP